MADYGIALYWPDPPTAAEQLLAHVVVLRALFPAGLSRSRARLDVAATAAYTLDLKHNGSAWGKVSFAAGSLTGAFTAADAMTAWPGDWLTVHAPASADATAAGIALTLMGEQDTSGLLTAILDATTATLSGCLEHPRLYALLEADTAALQGRMLPANGLAALLDASTAQIVTAYLSDVATYSALLGDDAEAELVGRLTVLKDGGLYL